MKKLYLVNLGCVRNLVDGEVMLARLGKAHYAITDDPLAAEVIVVNTCSFIINAIDESIDTILELAKFKDNGRCRRLIVTGCFPERFRKDIVASLPEVDVFLGTGAYDRIVDAADGRLDDSGGVFPDPDTLAFPETIPARMLSVPHTAYVKVAEGCDRHCSYCIIPKLRGRQRSRPPEQIIEEATSLIASGVKEIILVAENTTDYGRDVMLPFNLSDIMQNIAALSGDFRLRLLYGHPESADEPLIKTVAENEKICSYFDLPIQHAADSVLRKMGRTYGREDLYRLFEKIRCHLPDAALRTTVIVGFPGETRQDFETLVKFIEDIRFDHLGVFSYSDSEDLASHHLPGHVPERIAEERHDYLMALQAGISRQKNQHYVGQTISVLIEEMPEAGLYLGRSCFQAPEVDGVTFVYPSATKALKPNIGEFVDVTVTDAFEYDLAGETV